MKPEYWKEGRPYKFFYKVLSKKDKRWTVLKVNSDAIFMDNLYCAYITELSEPCTEADFMKRYNQTLKKIEKAVAK